MKKLLVLLMVLALAVPSMAAVTLTGTATGLTATIGYNWDGTGSRPRAFALRIQASAGTITAVGKVKTADGVSTAASPGYGIFPGTIAIDTAGNVTSYGNPVEPATLPGASGTGIGTNAVIVALGSLYVGDANKPGNASNLLTVTASTGCTLTVTQETTNRGGVVGEDAATIAATPNPLTIVLALAECVKNTAPFYNDWSSFGKPSCWCFARQPRGDADGGKAGTTIAGYNYVSAADLNVLSQAWPIKEPPKGSGLLGKTYNNAGVIYLICADFDHNKAGTTIAGYNRVSAADLNLLSASWPIKEPPKGSGIPLGYFSANPIASNPANYNTQY